MAKKGGGDAGGNSKKAQGQARKAEAAASKQAEKDRQSEAAEAAQWNKGAKSNAKAEAAADKAAEAARKKAEKAALLAEEEASMPSKPKGKAPKAEKKTRGGIDSALESFDKPSALNASGIDNALDALDLTGDSKDKLDRHPERRYKAAYAKFEEAELGSKERDEDPGWKALRRNQKIQRLREEFDKHPDNPKNQVSVAYNASKDDIKAVREAEKEKTEKRLGGNN